MIVFILLQESSHFSILSARIWGVSRFLPLIAHSQTIRILQLSLPSALQLRLSTRRFPVILFFQKVLSGFRPFEQMAVMAMPKTAVNKQNSTIFSKYKIRFSGQTSNMNPVAKSPGKKQFANKQFRFGILASDASHHAASNRGADNINHVYPSVLFRQEDRLLLV